MRFVRPEEADAYAERLRKRIVESRAVQGISLRNLAKLAGVTRRTVQRVCKGGDSFSLATMYAICAALGIQFEEITEEDSDFEDS